jgi:hypothetical protein
MSNENLACTVETVLTDLLYLREMRDDEIVSLLKKKSTPNVDINAMKMVHSELNIQTKFIDTYMNLISQMRDFDLSGAPKHIGSMSYQTQLSWEKYGGLKIAKSKSDISIGINTLSVKCASTKVRLLEVRLEQILAHINHAIEKSDASTNAQMIVNAHIERLGELFKSESYSIKRQINENGDRMGIKEMRMYSSKQTQKEIELFDENAQQIQDITQKIFAVLFDNSTNFMSTLISEAISGYDMFGLHSEGRADQILTWDKSLQKVELIPSFKFAFDVSDKIEPPVVKTKANQSTINKVLQICCHP